MDGRFRFDRDVMGNLFPVGSYVLEYSATQYISGSVQFVVAANEDKDLGNIAVEPLTPIGSISGQLVDAKTGAPLPGYSHPYASVTLYDCNDPFGNCYSRAWQTPDSNGRFRFEGNPGNPLYPGMYYVAYTATMYESGQTAQFFVAGGEHRDLSAITMTPFPTVPSISGRVVDAATGAPLSGIADPYAYVTLMRCIQWSCTSVSTSPDADGNFRFDRDPAGLPLLAGFYQIYVNASQYNTYNGSFTAEPDIPVDLGNVCVQSLPVRFSELTPCDSIPASGGICRYSMRVTNGMAEALRGATWSIVEAYSFGWGASAFQTAVPQRIQLGVGRSQVVSFQFRVPPDVPESSFFCASVYVSRDPNTLLFNLAGNLPYTMCVSKTGSGYQMLPAEQARDMARQREAPPARRLR